MNTIQKNEVMQELHRVLNVMDVPKDMFDDINWLDCNLAVNNDNHPNYLLAQWLIKKLKENENE